jgi:glycosyltransferase involved in cell wall biosynthesis
MTDDRGTGHDREVRIALDGTPLTGITGGIARYTSELAKALGECFPKDEVWLLSDQPMPDLGMPGNVKRGPGPTSLIEQRWWLWGLQRQLSRLQMEVFHGTDFAVPYMPTRPSVMTIHDLSPWLNRNWHVAAGRVRKRTPVLLRLGLATLVLTPSEAVRRAAIDRFSVPSERIVAVPLAASSFFRPIEVAPAARPYFLFVGTLEPRKNIGLLVDAWRPLKAEAELVIAGRRRRDFSEIPPEAGLTVLGAVPDEKLPELYSGCIACVYPSLYEGFGLPVLEAMQCGAPVITSRDPAIVETAGSAAITLDVVNHNAWGEALKSVLRNGEWVRELRSRSLKRALEFSWTKTACRTHEVYEEAIRRFRDYET